MNAYYAYKEFNESSMSLLTYQNYVIEYYVDGVTEDICNLDAGEAIAPLRVKPEVRVGRAVRAPPVHTPSTFAPTAGRQRPQRRCVICTAQGVQRDTRYYCSHCANSSALYFPACFRNYQHTVDTL